MALSMTGCGEGTATDGGASCRVELRCVNNRGFKLQLRCRDGFSALEPRVEAVVRRRVTRGTVQVAIDVTGTAAPAARRLDAAQLAAYLDAVADFCAARALPPPTAVEPFLMLPGVFVDAGSDAGMVERAWPLVSRALDEALGRLHLMRGHEGATLAADMRRLCGEIGGYTAQVAGRVPLIVESHRARMSDRVAKLLEPQGVSLDPAAVAREVAVIADRSDIAEELVRLTSHVAQFERLLGEDAAGRQLDFLAQELGREANTIAAKASDVEVAHAVVEIKTRIERLREQVQNIE